MFQHQTLKSRSVMIQQSGHEALQPSLLSEYREVPPYGFVLASCPLLITIHPIEILKQKKLKLNWCNKYKTVQLDCVGGKWMELSVTLKCVICEPKKYTAFIFF